MKINKLYERNTIKSVKTLERLENVRKIKEETRGRGCTRKYWKTKENK